MGDLDEKIANFNPENNNSERRMRTKGSLPYLPDIGGKLLLNLDFY